MIGVAAHVLDDGVRVHDVVGAVSERESATVAHEHLDFVGGRDDGLPGHGGEVQGVDARDQAGDLGPAPRVSAHVEQVIGEAGLEGADEEGETAGAPEAKDARVEVVNAHASRH
ncbi:MAG: hypothetical protein M5U12_20910 [Verrucomicrobia bacterium]|nr:hypothetical protein [Verrucomicrobiota bacterium]